MSIILSDEQRGSLRQIRLYHWLKYLESQSAVESALADETRIGNMIAAARQKDANIHIGFVQHLNQFFDMGDTAESDVRMLEAIGAKI